MATHPYEALPSHCFWRQSIASPQFGDVDPVVRAKFTVTRADRVATAGSCLAQHIARHLSASGFHYLVTERPHPITAVCDTKRYRYGVFTARYGNVYTTRQLIQLLKRAYGRFFPDDDVWHGSEGRLIDPFRPRIQPKGFASLAEYEADRVQHSTAVRQAIETMDVFVFTLGLTETWVSRSDGAAYPLCPGVAGGVFDESRYAFLNLSVSDVIADLEAAIALIQSKNSDVRVILTVSPVPLVATAEDRSVLVSTTYSKAVLRVAAEQVSSAHPFVAYFPSYEVIAGNYNRGRYYEDDLREVTSEGVDHVMRLFMKHYARADLGRSATPAADERDHAPLDTLRQLDEEAAVICDEVALGRS
jgi:hypothetical protein